MTDKSFNNSTSYEINFNIYNNSNYNVHNISKNSSLIDKAKNKSYNNYSPNNSSILKKIKFRNKALLYIGDNKEGKKHGFGKQIWTKDSYFIGYYKDNEANGIGKFVSLNNIYAGEFKSDMANGYGIYNNNKNGLLYEGYWNKDLQSKYGIEKWKDDSIYMGEYFSGKKNGIGVYLWQDGSKYEGEFKDNEFNGYGIYYFSENKVFQGQWKNNKKEGYGEFIINDKIFIGFYSNDKKNGFGLLYWKEYNKVFIGFWKDGKKNGFGKLLSNNKIKYYLYKDDIKISKFNSDKEAQSYLDKNEMKNYQNIFIYSKDDLIKFIDGNSFYKNISK